MIPLKSLPDPRKKPILTFLLITLNVVVFLIQAGVYFFGHTDIAGTYGVVPKCYLVPSGCGVVLPEEANRLALPFISAMFLHADILHLGFNMLFLWIFGAGLEDKIGRMRFVLVYFGGGIVASLAHLATHPWSMTPVVGASGAIAAVLGAYLVVLPKAWVLTYFPPIFFFPVPAPLFLLVWAVAQAWNALGDVHWISPTGGSGVAWMAHLGGFLTGALYGWQLAPWIKKRRRWSARGARA